MKINLFSADKIRWFAAETLVVVLGILIALSLDDYMSARRDRALGIDYVQRIRCSAIADLNYARNNWKPAISAKRDALNEILPVIRGKVPVPEDLAGFFQKVGSGGIFSGSDPTWIADTVFQDIRSTGNLRLLQGPFRGNISGYYGSVEVMMERLRGRNTDYVAYVHTAIPAELRGDMTIEALQDFDIDYALQRILSDEFRNLANAEYNKLLFMQTLDFEGAAAWFLNELEAFRVEYATSTDWHCGD